MKRSELKYLICLFLFLICINNQDYNNINSGIIYYNIGDIINAQNSNINQGKGFHVIQINQLTKKYLFFQIMPKDQRTQFLDIGIYIYKGTQKTPFKICKQQQVDSCFIPSSQLINVNHLVIEIDCKELCTYNLTTYWSNIQHINPGQEVKFVFDLQKTQIYHLQIDKVEQFSEIQLVLRPQTKRQMFDKVKIYGKFGKNNVPTPQSYDFKSMHLWQDAQGIYLYKQQIKDPIMTLLITGQANTVYLFSCKIVKQKSHKLQIGEWVDEYLQPKQTATYHLNFTSNKTGLLDHEEYVFKFSAYNGNLSVQFYTDQNFKNQYLLMPYEYMSDAQYIFNRDHILKYLINGIYIKTTSFDRISTYTISFIGRSKKSAIQLDQHVFQFIELEQSKQKLAYLNWFAHKEDNNILTLNHTFTVNLINVKGSHSIIFRICSDQLQKCLNQQTYQNNSKLIQVNRFDEIGKKKSYRLQIPKTMLTNINIVEQRITILAIINSINSNNTVCALEFYSDSKYQLLRESRPIESRFKIHQTKLYKFTNVDKKIKQVRIHINRISGLVNVVSLRTDPLIKNDGKKQASNIISFTTDLIQKPIYLVIFSEQQSIISLDVQLIHQNSQIISTITMQQDIQFKIKIPPLNTQFIQVHPVFDNIYFDYKSSGLVNLCQYQQNKCKTQLPSVNTQGSIKIDNFHGTSQIIMISNPSSNKIIQFKAIYHSANYSHCQQRATGSIYQQFISHPKCFLFPLAKQTDFQISIIRLDIGILNSTFLLCNNVLDQKQYKFQNLYKIPKEKIEKYCQNYQHRAIIIAIVNQNLINEAKNKSNSNNLTKSFEIKLSVQYQDQGAILIPDGIPYQTKKIAKQQTLQVFYYEILNNVNTTIILTNNIGNAYFNVKVAQTVDRHQFISKKQFDFSSNTQNYYQNPAITIPQQAFKDLNCQKDCSLIIKIFSKQKIGAINQFMFQVTQNYYTLRQHKMKSDFLVKGSIRYYKFKNKRQNNTVVINTSDNNKKCTKIIFGQNEYPSNSKNLMIEYGNQLIYQNAYKRIYFITVQAIQNCAYQITVSSTPLQIIHLQRGKLGYLKLKKYQVKYFMFHRLTINPFKILSIHVYGQLDFYLNVSNTQKLQQFVNKKQIDYQNFTFKGQYKNRLIMDNPKQLCQNCYYILACHAKKDTDTSVYFGDSDSFLDISQKKSINDYLKNKGDSLKGYYHEIQDTKIKIKIHSGQLKLKLTYFDQKYQKKFPKFNDLYEEEIQLKRKPQNWDPALIQFIAMDDQTLYSIRLISKTSDSYSKMIDQTQVIAGQPNYLSVKKDRVHCLKGYLRDKNQAIMITSDNYYEKGLHKMKIQVTLNGVEVGFNKQSVKNIITIKFNLTNIYLGQPQKFGICLSNNQESFAATAFQTEDVSILPQDIQTIVQGQRKFAIRPDGDFLIDIYQCKGKANITYAQSLNDLPNAKKTSLDIIGMPEQPHSFKINQYLTTFLKLQSQQAIIRWIPINLSKQTGLGYLNYQVGPMKYSTTSNSIDIEWNGIKAKKQSNTIVKKINYTIYFSNDSLNLQNAQNCEIIHDQNVIQYKIVGNSPQNIFNPIQKYQAKKVDLMQKYKNFESLFMTIVADVDIQPLNGTLQHYRFFYSKQQLAKQIFLSDTQYINTAMNIGLIVIIIIGFLIFSYVFTKKIIPLLARLKNRMLVQQQENKQKSKQMQDVPPPSSERKTIQANIGTEDGMNDQIKR